MSAHCPAQVPLKLVLGVLQAPGAQCSVGSAAEHVACLGHAVTPSCLKPSHWYSQRAATNTFLEPNRHHGCDWLGDDVSSPEQVMASVTVQFCDFRCSGTTTNQRFNILYAPPVQVSDHQGGHDPQNTLRLLVGSSSSHTPSSLDQPSSSIATFSQAHSSSALAKESCETRQ